MICNSAQNGAIAAATLVAARAAQWAIGGESSTTKDVIAAGAAVVTMVALQALQRFATPKLNETVPEMVGRRLLPLPPVKRSYMKKIKEQYLEFCKETQEQWKQFGEPITAIPEKGYSLEQLQALVRRFASTTNDPLKDQRMSGAIYQPAPDRVWEGPPREATSRVIGGVQQSLAAEAVAKLDVVFPEAEKDSRLWSMLHREFGIGNFIEYLVSQMVAEMFGGAGLKTCGFVTSGGTEGLMQAMYGYRQWGRERRGHDLGESVIVAADTVHASVDKAASKYDMMLVKIQTGEDGVLDVEAMRAAMKKYGDRVVVVIGSTASYPTGQVDPIREIAAIAREAGCGCHVDACLGAWVIDNLEEHDTNYFGIDGVTSCTGCLHKGGLVDKGASALVFRGDVDQDLGLYSAFSVARWRGGVYATPRDPGSQSVVPAFKALLTMLAVGKQGYREAAQNISRVTQDVRRLIDSMDGQLKVLGNPSVNVVAFKVDERLGLERNATYALTRILEERGITLNNIAGDAAHLCVTTRLTQDKGFVAKLSRALKNGIQEVQELDVKIKNDPTGKTQFPGEAQLYGSVQEVSAPDRGKGWKNFLENTFFGTSALDLVAKGYSLAKNNPFLAGRLS